MDGISRVIVIDVFQFVANDVIFQMKFDNSCEDIITIGMQTTIAKRL